MKWYWPTEAGWFIIVFLIFCAIIVGGWEGGLIMFAFCALLNVIGNKLFP